MIRPVHTHRAPQPAGHYSQAVVHGGTVYVAGLLPFDPDAPGAPLGTTEEQARRALESLRAVLEAAGSAMDQLLQVTVFVSDLSDWGTVNEVFAELLGEHRPARCVVPVLPLKRGAALEVMAIAAQRDS